MNIHDNLRITIIPDFCCLVFYSNESAAVSFYWLHFSDIAPISPSSASATDTSHGSLMLLIEKSVILVRVLCIGVGRGGGAGGGGGEAPQ